MGRKRSFKKKDKFDALDSDFKDAAASMKEPELRAQISKIALADESLRQEKENDLDLRDKGEIYRTAGAIYREGAKMNRLRIAFIKRVLEDQGKDTGDTTVTLSVNGGPPSAPVSLKVLKQAVEQ